MPRQLLSIVKPGPNSSDADGAGSGPEREELLIERLLALPADPRGRPADLDRRLVRVASVLLDSDLLLERAFNWGSWLAPVQRILLLVYVRQGQGRDISIRSLRDLSILGPGTVALRWTAKLVGDGIVEMFDAGVAADRLLRLSTRGVGALERWLGSIDSGLGRGAQASFDLP